MQLPTHLIAGILIQFIITALFPSSTWFSILLIIIISFCSHFLLDATAKFTYHPSERIHDNFWLAWHIFVYLTGFTIIIIFFQIYWLGMLFANLPDIWDWYTLRNIASKKNEPEWGEKYYLHPIANKVRTVLFSRLPNFNHTKAGILPELLLIISWFIFIFFFNHLLV